MKEILAWVVIISLIAFVVYGTIDMLRQINKLK